MSTHPAPAGDHTDVPSRPSRRGCFRVEAATLALMIVAGGVALIVGIGTRSYDYDELTRAHSAWLTAQGLRPYTDYFECHPPYFPLLVPIVRACRDPVDLLRALRLLGIAGNLLFLAGLGRLVTTSPGDRRWGWLGLGVVALDPAVLEFLVEFRVDGWGYALATWTLIGATRARPGPRRDLGLGLGTGLAAFLFCPKLALLPPMIVVFAMLGNWRSARSAFRIAAAYAAGTATAGGLVALLLVTQGIRFEDVFQLLVRYHTIANATSSFHRGLIRSILDQPVLLGVTCFGLTAWAIDRIHRRSWPGPVEAGLAAWLGLQAILVAYPYKQYYAPWFLFASVYLAYLGMGRAGRPGRLRATFFVLTAGLASVGALGRARAWADADEARHQGIVIRWMGRVAGPGEYVVAAPPFHPIDRRDSFFLWFNTIDPGGFDSETILGRLPSYRDRASPAHFLGELVAHPPALVTLSDRGMPVFYTAGQFAALREFLARNGYRAVRRGDGEFAVRPDRLEAAR
ncbi:hypothetical protein TA3x_005317 [Tundrisphaera sp. TA3]|uniref:hypothetical protein n=1 Tax=Tundrisphaera sp. TA3 TaxID=3435775 RepID=UPI003EBE2E05